MPLSSLISRLRVATVAALMAQCITGPGRAEDDFYKGKTINLIIATTSGGGYDTYSRLIARHLGRHLPGQTQVVPPNHAGEAGHRAPHYLYSSAPSDFTTIYLYPCSQKDSITIVMHYQATHLDHILVTPGLNADAARFNWIGRILSNSSVLYAWHLAKVKTIEDALTHELVVAAPGASS